MNYTLTAIDDTRAGISAEIICNDDGERTILLFKPSVWKEEGVKKGECFDDEVMQQLRNAADFSRAIARAEGMLASSDYSRQRLISRLLHYNLPRDICEKTAEYMIEHGYINEEDQTKRITRFFCIRKHWGKKRIAAELMGRGYDRKVIFASLATVSDEEYFNSLMAYVEKKYPEPCEDKAERERRIASLSRLGYSISEINRALGEAEEFYMENTSDNE